MPRAARILGNDITYHVVSKCNAKELLFKTDADFNMFLKHLDKCQQNSLFDIHAYCLMRSHIHLILTTRQDIFLDKVMYEICQRFSHQYNKDHNREGHFWKNRYFSKVIKNDIYGLVCLRYLHLNPVKAGLVSHPEQWTWSCVRNYVRGEPNSMLIPLPSYLGLAEDQTTRQKYYLRWLNSSRLSQKIEQKLMESKLHTHSRRFQQLLRLEVSPIIRDIQTRM